LNVIITGTGFSFPDGTGATARVMSFAKGLMHHGATVHVFLPKPTENETTGERNSHLQGVHEGIPFEYTCGQRLVAKTRVGALFLYLRGLWRACQAISRVHQETPVDAIILWYAEHPTNFVVYAILAKALGAVLVAEKSEFPFVYYQKTIAVRLMIWFYENVTLRILDGVIVISKFLHEYFFSCLRNTDKILRVPILVETSSYPQPFEKPDHDDRRIIYCGNLDHGGEITSLLDAFSQVAGDFPQLRLHIIGDTCERNQRDQLNALIAKLALTGLVQFIGQRPRQEIPLLLSQGDIMALPRAAGMFSTAGFPTKLGEYLATGKPVVVTDTGDISQYLQDGVNAFITTPGDTVAFARALRRVMLRPEEAATVGRGGREVALKQFDTFVNCSRIVEFIQKLKTSG